MTGAWFQHVMAELGPWPADRRVAVAVSGGADSVCLAWLASRWGRPFGLIVDHGLRAESAAEACVARDRLAGFGVPSQVLTLAVSHGSGLAARARAARYAALTEVAVGLGLCDILIGHHAGDQAETVLMRAARGSGQAGLSGMAAIVERPLVRLVRPLLTTPPDRLRAILHAQDIGWTEDPSNSDPRATRTRARARLTDRAFGAVLAGRADMAGTARREAEQALARVLAERVAIFPEGYALLSPGPIAPDVLGALLRGLTGAPYTPRGAALARMASGPRPGTLGGVRMLRAGRLGPLLLVREAAAMQAPIKAEDGAVWDDRYVLETSCRLPDGAELGALGDESRLMRDRSRLPACVLATLPALRATRPGGGRALAVPHLGYGDGWTDLAVRVGFVPSMPMAGAPFRVMVQGDAQWPVAPHVQDAAVAGWSF